MPTVRFAVHYIEHAELRKPLKDRVGRCGKPYEKKKWKGATLWKYVTCKDCKAVDACPLCPH